MQCLIIEFFLETGVPELTGEEKGKNGFSKGKGDLDLQGFTRADRITDWPNIY